MTESTFGYEGYEEARAIARRRRTRIALPIGVVAIMLAALIGIAIYEYRTMRADALALSKGVVVNLQSRIETEVDAFLRPVRGITRLTRDLIADRSEAGIPVELSEALGVGMLTNAPQLTALFIGDRSGEFLMVRRFREDDQTGLETKHIRPTADDSSQREIGWTRRADDGRVVGTEVTPWDQYDPRLRPWYQGADRERALYWTDVYPFFTGATAGVTAAVPLTDAADQLRAVVGTDVSLDSISRFLGTLSIGKSGVALIVDDAGRVIAHPEAELIRENTDGKIRLTRLADLQDPVLDRAFDRYRVEGHGRRDFEIDGRSYISSVSSLNHLLERDWSVMVLVPEDDFVGFVVENVREALAMGLGVIALAAILAVLLIRQGLRADREALQILDRQRQLDAQGEAFGRLATYQCASNEPRQPRALAPVTESLTRAAGVRRASVWHLDSDTGDLRCIECFDRDSEGHTQGARISRDEHPALITALAQREPLAVVDAGTDARTSSLHHQYLSPLGCRALLAVPVVAADQVEGTLWLEDGITRTEWPRHTVSFVGAVANLLALRDDTAAPEDAAAPAVPAAVPATGCDAALQQHFGRADPDTSLAAERAAKFSARMAVRLDGAEPHAGAQLVERLAVLTLRLTDTLALAEPMNTDRETPTGAALLQELQAAATTHDIGYLKFFSDQVVAAADPTSSAEQSLERLIEFALAAKSDCERLLADCESPLAFRIGIDFGPVIGSLVDDARQTFTFWGEAVRVAGVMANTALPGTIQVSESVYQGLKDRYLFQLRGHHYLEGSGEFATYLLGGRL